MSRIDQRRFYFPLDRDVVPEGFQEKGPSHPYFRLRVSTRGSYRKALAWAEENKLKDGTELTDLAVLAIAIVRISGDFTLALDSFHITQEWPADMETRVQKLDDQLAVTDMAVIWKWLFSQLRLTEMEEGESEGSASDAK